jgi:two-component system, response regulator
MIRRSSVILLVEDSDDDAELTLRALRRNKVANEVVRLADGVEALEYLEANGRFEGRNRADVPDLVLLDIKLPRVNGLEVLRTMRADEANGAIPVVVLSSSVEQRDLENAYALGANSYVQKPVDFDRFVDAVGQIGSYWLRLNETPDVHA